ncbi:bacillithiol system redox-active protein YtxJ [Shouchella lonarensis]|uniref:Bacillithiol system protein YtxJ n=1 Tax=Shouchella lonarensis TaxID=1464122 RepID=A0A1G6H6Y3_9BACI|nr:bacillithiol system redox-active protein YtxJ [Shouchella lonarensis]SDB89914.1 bacillithiol system protein YtxJ [Shouchella lonarensis]
MIELTTEAAWHDLYEQSKDKTVLVFKHSTQCPVSSDAHKQFLAFVEENPDFVYGWVKVIESRPVSNLIAEELETVHKSPQLFVLKDKKVAWTTSHWDITKEAIAKNV